MSAEVNSEAIAEQLAKTRARLDAACVAAGRAPGAVTLMAVSKKQPVDALRAAWHAGQRVFGENYVQELVEKADALATLEGLRIHLIGHLQRNKVKPIVRVRACVDTVDSPRLLDALAAECARQGVVLPICIQVNVAREEQKSGCATSELPALIRAARACEAVRLDGLMTVPQAGEPQAARPYFRMLRMLAEEHGLTTLSMGMTADLEVAVQEGATCVRVGTAIFGARG